MAAPALHTEFLSIASGVSGYLAKPSGVPGIGVVVMMEAFGLNAFVKGICDRFARAGYMALAPDIYHGETFDYADRERAIARVNEVDDESRCTKLARRSTCSSHRARATDGSQSSGSAWVGGSRFSRTRFTARGSPLPCRSTAAASRPPSRAANASR